MEELNHFDKPLRKNTQLFKLQASGRYNYPRNNNRNHNTSLHSARAAEAWAVSTASAAEAISFKSP